MSRQDWDTCAEEYSVLKRNTYALGFTFNVIACKVLDANEFARLHDYALIENPDSCRSVIRSSGAPPPRMASLWKVRPCWHLYTLHHVSKTLWKWKLHSTRVYRSTSGDAQCCVIGLSNANVTRHWQKSQTAVRTLNSAVHSIDSRA